MCRLESRCSTSIHADAWGWPSIKTTFLQPMGSGRRQRCLFRVPGNKAKTEDHKPSQGSAGVRDPPRHVLGAGAVIVQARGRGRPRHVLLLLSCVLTLLLFYVLIVLTFYRLWSRRRR